MTMLDKETMDLVYDEIKVLTLEVKAGVYDKIGATGRYIGGCSPTDVLDTLTKRLMNISKGVERIYTDWCYFCGVEHDYMSGPCSTCGSHRFTKEQSGTIKGSY